MFDYKHNPVNFSVVLVFIRRYHDIRFVVTAPVVNLAFLHHAYLPSAGGYGGIA